NRSSAEGVAALQSLHSIPSVRTPSQSVRHASFGWGYAEAGAIPSRAGLGFDVRGAPASQQLVGSVPGRAPPAAASPPPIPVRRTCQGVGSERPIRSIISCIGRAPLEELSSVVPSPPI